MNRPYFCLHSNKILIMKKGITLLIFGLMVILNYSVAQVTIWSENFSSNSNDDMVGNDNNLPIGADWTTSCATCNRANEFRVEGGEYRTENTDEIATWTSELIDISGYTGVGATVSIDMDDNHFDATDCIAISYVLDGGVKTQFTINGNLCDDRADPTIASFSGLTGSTLQIIIDAITTNNNEDLHFDDIVVVGTIPVVLDNGPGSGNCLDFDGNNDYVEVGDVLIDGLSDVTLEAWIYPQTISTNGSPSGHNANEGAIIHKSGASDDNLGLTVSSGGLTFYLDNGSDNTLIASVPSINEWAHVAATYDGSNMHIYINGILDASLSVSGSGSIINNTNTLRFGGVHGAVGGNPHSFDGRIDEIRIWSTARTQTQIRDNMCKKQLGSETNLLAYYRFDEPSGTSLVDHVGSNDGTLNNMTNADWVTSGASLANSSVHLYTGSWGGTSVFFAIILLGGWNSHR
jgi:hypothetical protein